jgi:DNA invertase Pin-like site-specific DNA recombinase
VARYGYARISTRSQRDDSQLDALREASCERIWTDTASGRLARRPQWDACLDHLRAGDELAVTRLSRMARSVRHLTEVAALLSERGIDLIVLKQGIDTSTASGRFTFHVLAAMDQMLAELIAEGTKEGLAAARARGRVGGRPPRLTARQVEVARGMYDELGDDGKRKHTVDEIAETFAVSRKTIYRHLATDGPRRQPDKSTRQHRPTRPASAGPRSSGGTSAATAPPMAQSRRPQRGWQATAATPACPSCGNEPTTRPEALRQRADLAVVWLHQDAAHGPISQHQHCAACQPHDDCGIFECARCGAGPLLTGALADDMRNSSPHEPPTALCAWLTKQGWQLKPEPVCPDHQR